MGLRARDAKLCEAEGRWQDLVRSTQGGWSKEHFEPCRALACLLMDLPRAGPAAFVQRISWIIPWALESCFFFKKQFFKKGKFGGGCRGNALGQVGWGSMCVGEARMATYSLVGWPDSQGQNSLTCGVHSCEQGCLQGPLLVSVVSGREAYGRLRLRVSWALGYTIAARTPQC